MLSSAQEPVEGPTEVPTAPQFEVAGPGQVEKPSVLVIVVGPHPVAVAAVAAVAVAAAAVAAESAALPSSVVVAVAAAAVVAVAVEEASAVHHALRPVLQLLLGRVAIVVAPVAAGPVVGAS